MVRVALMGCGRIAKRHASILASGQIPELSLSAVCDSDFGKAQRLGVAYGVPFYSDIHALIQNEAVDIVSILTPSGMHARHAEEVVPYGKDIIIEKPMAWTLEDADRVIDACSQYGVRLFVVKQNRFNVPVIKLREALDNGRFGKLVLGTIRVRWCRDQSYYDLDDWRGTWRNDGGVLANQAIHHIDLLQWLMGDVDSVICKVKTALVTTETEDTSVAVVRFKNQALGVIEATTAARPLDLEGSISILGEKGAVVIGGFAVNKMQTWAFFDKEEGDELVTEAFSTNPPSVYGFGHVAFYQHVRAAIMDGAIYIDGNEGRKSLVVMTALYESAESGVEVFLDRMAGVTRLGK